MDNSLLRLSLVFACAGLATCFASRASAQPVSLADDSALAHCTVGGYVYVNARTGERSVSSAPPIGRSDFFPILVNRDAAANGNRTYLIERPGFHGNEMSNWADIPFDSRIDAYAFAYGTTFFPEGDPPVPPSVTVTHWWWNCDNGFNDAFATPVWSIAVDGLMNSTTGSSTPEIWVYVMDLDGSGLEFELGDTDGTFVGVDGQHSTGCDRDNELGDPLADFSWSYAFVGSSGTFEPQGQIGPLLALPAIAGDFEDYGIPTGAEGLAAGVADFFDFFRSPPGESRATYTASFWFGGWPAAPYASTYMGLYGSNPRDCGPADFNADTTVDVLDFLDFIDDFSNCENQPAPCGTIANTDLGGDTIVDILDFLDFMDVFAACE